jgi:hypothetical protein
MTSGVADPSSFLPHGTPSERRVAKRPRARQADRLHSGATRRSAGLQRGRRESEWAALAVAAHGPALAGMHDAATELANAREGCGEVRHLEVGERHGVAGTTAAGVHAERRPGGWALPAAPLIWGPRREIDAEDAAPKAQGAIGVVGGELDQPEREAVHWDTVARWRNCP